MNYTEYKNMKQEEFDKLPIFYAFGNDQFKKAMEERGLKETDTDKIYALGHVGYYLRSDADIVRAYFKKKDELPELMKDHEFAVSAFRYEMDNHEYAINWQADYDVCSCFGHCEYGECKDATDYLSEMGYGDDVVKAYMEARRSHYKAADENEWF